MRTCLGLCLRSHDHYLTYPLVVQSLYGFNGLIQAWTASTTLVFTIPRDLIFSYSVLFFFFTFHWSPLPLHNCSHLDSTFKRIENILMSRDCVPVAFRPVLCLNLNLRDL
ncbi:hypothetical protein BDV36DRAFT_252001 [Aspergillus pseudocaelatus]|uniref:Uncharacterized protein n=1 Tax=Aspergillus pseudocaelatus TaxID=1825620 RepID=A0ABQ6WQH5_9EURO|nr:hypothetical protein BDV36DRAFT_252001 [Aspergillus pseudocaelatus]